MASDKRVIINNDGMWGLVWFLATVGVAIYYVQQATDFWGAVLGILKALVWPAMLMYRIFTDLHM
ncbi:MAG: hypothetical protein KA339_02615 [Candidatus Kapabacteria bacterium]|nr:hypothetical protein [Ignavibacteria bacterium]MBK6418840.1 hypothetical protein [Ignavibacteria bacterium]MBK7411746.1 hypothetical protein [Ignavibacteria bacterium]MBP6509423.1 hypothetical protein [Candidatus Kapabacteria bacterium]MBP7093048.1 hypothetical protein [Candidatus Kapabacteria bacterium]